MMFLKTMFETKLKKTKNYTEATTPIWENINSSIGWGGGVTEHFRAPYSIIAIRCSYSVSVEQFHGQSSVSHFSFFVD